MPLAFYCWYLTLRGDLEHWPCDLDLRPFDLEHLWCIGDDAQTLYQIWAKSSIPRRSYCHLNIWPNNLEHVTHVVLRSGIIFTKFELGQPISSWLITFFSADTSRHAVTFNFDRLISNLKGHWLSRGQTPYQNWAKIDHSSAELLMIY